MEDVSQGQERLDEDVGGVEEKDNERTRKILSDSAGAVVETCRFRAPPLRPHACE